MCKIKGFRGGVRTMIHLNALITRPPKRIVKPSVEHGIKSAKIQSVAIMHAGTIGLESAKNMPPGKNPPLLPNKKPHARYLAHGLGQHVCVTIWANGTHLKKCANATHKPKNSKTANVNLSLLAQQTPTQPAHNLIWGHATWANDKKKNQQP